MNYTKVSNLLPADALNIQNRLSNIRATLLRIIDKWEQSGQGDGGRMPDSENEEGNPPPDWGTLDGRLGSKVCKFPCSRAINYFQSNSAHNNIDFFHSPDCSYNAGHTTHRRFWEVHLLVAMLDLCLHLAQKHHGPMLLASSLLLLDSMFTKK